MANAEALVGINTAEFDRKDLVEKFGKTPGDVGSPEVQIALLTKRIQTLTRHFETNHEDKHSMRGMMRMISRRKKLLAYLRAVNVERYRTVLAALGLRK